MPDAELVVWEDSGHASESPNIVLFSPSLLEMTTSFFASPFPTTCVLLASPLPARMPTS